MLRVAKWVLAILVFALGAAAGWLYQAPPELIRVGAAYSAKIVCSNVFLAGRDPQDVLAVDVQAPGHPLLKLMQVEVDENLRTVTAGLLGIFGRETALAHGDGGCSSVPNHGLAAARRGEADAAPVPALPDAPWPQGNRVEASQDPALAKLLDDPALTGPGMRAVVVVRDGRIVAERYGEGFSAATPLLGWSMTKTVTAAIIGTLVKAGRMDVAKTGLFADWTDGRATIAVADLMAMSSGLAFNEDYGDVTDVTRMLFLEPDMAGFAAGKALAGKVGEAFSYSSGTTVMLSRLWQEAAGADATGWPRSALFSPLGMTSAVLEADSRGTYVGSSYLYATAHDWARFGQFLLQDGVWNGATLLPDGFVGWMREPAPAAGGEYGRGQVWLRGPEGLTPAGQDPDAGFTLPDDAFWALGHDGQSMAMIPSKRLIVLRMGLTPKKLGYKPQALVAAIAALP